MANTITERLDQGVVTSRDATQLGPGELQRAVGGQYKPNDPRLHKQRGRGLFGSTGATGLVKGVRVLQFDAGGTDKLVALRGTVLYGATPGTSGTFSSLKTGLDSTATRLSAAQYANRWYLATNGDADRMFVVESDGTVYDAGLYPYAVAPTAVTSLGGVVSPVRPSAPTGTITDGANSIDTGTDPPHEDTYATISLSAPGTVTATWDWPVGGASTIYDLVIKHALQGQGAFGDRDRHPPRDGGSVRPDAGYTVQLKLELSTDGGVGYSTILESTYVAGFPPQGFQHRINTVNTTPVNFAVRATLTYISGLITAGWRFYEVYAGAANDARVAAFSTTTGLFYAVTEYDETRGVRSAIKDTTAIVTLSSENKVVITRPAVVNSRATHWEIWRTSDGGTPPVDLGKLDQVKISQTTYTDYFEQYPATVSPPFKYPMIQITVDEGTILVDQDQPPPNIDRVFSFKGSLLGIKGRVLRYSLAGTPESWPEIYGVFGFESEERDEFVTGADLGEIFILGGIGNIRRIQSLPRAAIGNLAYSAPEVIPGAPGCVGAAAMARFSVGGEPRVAWISQYGVFETNGFTIRRISDDWDWSVFEGFDKSTWVLHYDPERYVLILCYSSTSGTTPDRYALGHVHPSHLKQGGLPKWTLDHYGEIYDLASAPVGSQRRLYSAHTSDGKVYVEDYGTTDAALAYNADGDVPFIVQPRRLQSEGKEFAVLSAWLRSSAFGASQEMAMAWTAGRDTNTETGTRTSDLDIATARRVLFDISLGGDWHDVTFTHTGAATGWLGELVMQARPLGGAGEVKVA